ncbi:MAG: hypothetical protein KJO98_05465 [Rhodothermia bacterium]|nr:hypothetical protein [Rhodothermia bacterium]
MSYEDVTREIPDGVVKGTAGFFGMLAAIFLLPRLIRFTVRNYFFRAIAEIVAIVTLGLLTEKFTSWLAGDTDQPGSYIAPSENLKIPEEVS